jgi:hypothetical protein
MPKTRISEYSTTNSANTDIESINIDEGCAPSGINNAIRELMVHLKEFQTGASGDAFTFAGGVLISGTANTITGNVLMSGTNTITGSTTATFAAGAVGTPSIAAHGDTNTGIFFPAADTIAFTEGGAEAMRIDSDGDVGIGTSSPGKKLDILSNTSQDGIRISGSSNPRLTIIDTTTPVQFDVLCTDTEVVLRSDTNHPMVLSTNGTERMRIDTSGNVGIGTTSPGSFYSGGRQLVVGSGSGNQGITIYSGTSSNAGLYFAKGTTGNDPFQGQLFYNMTSDYMVFCTAAAERARITSGGYFKASDAGTYYGSTSSYHEFRQTTNSTNLVVNSTNASLSNNILFLSATRNTTNNTFYAIGFFNDTAAAYKFLVADSGNVTNTNGSYGTISDAKLKQDIVDAGSQWDDIKGLRFRKYRLKSDVEANPDAKSLLGLVAQETELVSPGLIEEHRDTKRETKTRDVEKTREVEVTPAVTDEEGNVVEPAVTTTETYIETEEYTETVDLGTTTKSIKTSILYMKAVKALQEAMERIEVLEAQNAAFEARLAALESK